MVLTVSLSVIHEEFQRNSRGNYERKNNASYKNSINKGIDVRNLPLVMVWATNVIIQNVSYIHVQVSVIPDTNYSVILILHT